jgi:hypothetical protein
MEALLILIAFAVVALLGAVAEMYGADSREPNNESHIGVR